MISSTIRRGIFLYRCDSFFTNRGLFFRPIHQSHNIPASFASACKVPTQKEPFYPAITLRSDIGVHLDDLSQAAATTGIASFASLGIAAPFDAIQALFDRLGAEPHLAARLNATYPKRGVYKTAGLHKPDVDQKLTVDLSAVRLERLNRLSPDTVRELGAELKEAVNFFKRVEAELVPQIMKATSAVSGFDMASLHTQMNNNYRMVDYFARPTAMSAPRCGMHRDYGTFSILFQNGASGGLEYRHPESSQWIAIPKFDAVVIWGWCAAILSDDRIRAAQHRVQITQPGTRRNSAVLFVAPDLDVTLSPRVGSGKGFSDALVNDQVTVETFKNISGKSWRKREGNEEGPVVQADDIELFVRTK